MLPESQDTEAVLQRRLKLHLALLAELGSVSTGTGFEVPRGSWRATEDYKRHCTRTEGAIGGGTASVSAEGPGLKGSCREVETWYHEERLGDAIG